MSVPVGERAEGRFTLDIKAEKLLRYTLEMDCYKASRHEKQTPS